MIKLTQVIREEFDCTRRTVLQIKGCARLLDSEPVLQRSIWLRNPYVDPMSFVQVMTLRRLRDLGEDDPQRDAVRDLVALCVNGIAAGLQNTG